MTDDALRVILPDPEEVQGWITDRKHWIVVFGEDDTTWVDALDEWVGVYPTFPTLVGRFLTTVIPKAALTRERLQGFITEHAPDLTLDDEADILLLTSDPDEDYQPMMLYVRDLAGLP